MAALVAQSHVERGHNGFFWTTRQGEGVEKQERGKGEKTEKAISAPCQVWRTGMRDSKWGKQVRKIRIYKELTMRDKKFL